MSYIEWSSRQSVCDDRIDAEHREIFRILNALHDLSLNVPRHPEIEARLVDLERISSEHFGFEEAFMRCIGHGELQQHQSDHRFFTRAVEDLHFKFVAGPGVAAESLEFLMRWFVDHIVGLDRRYASEAAAAKQMAN